MPEWPDGNIDNVSATVVIEGNIAQVLGHLDTMNASDAGGQSKKVTPRGIGTADISNIAHTLSVTSVQTNKKALQLPWRNQQSYKVASFPMSVDTHNLRQKRTLM